MIRPMFAAALLLSTPVAATPADDVAAALSASLADARAKGARFGLIVTEMDGRELIAIDADGRYMPASNTKLFTTAAAYATLPVATADPDGGAGVRLSDGDVILSGSGDARLSSAADCREDCLATLADAIAARTRTVRDVVGDATAFPDERWSSGMSWNNIPSRYGTALGALVVDDNEVALTVTPGGAAGAPATIAGDGYYTIDNRVVTVAAGEGDLSFDRLPASRVLRVTGTIAAGAAARTLNVGVDDPAHRAAWRLAAMLRDRGVRVTGDVVSRHRAAGAEDDPAKRGAAPVVRAPRAEALARTTEAPVAADIVTINKVSQNLHAELLLRRVGAATGSGSIADGQAAVRAMLKRAGIAPGTITLADGSGMSTYNRVSPRSVAALLRWAATQPWGADWRASLPVAGVDGTLARRFRGTPLEGRLFAKTGSINATNALSGYMIAASGKTLAFSAIANDVPDDVQGSAALDGALVRVAAGF